MADSDVVVLCLAVFIVGMLVGLLIAGLVLRDVARAKWLTEKLTAWKHAVECDSCKTPSARYTVLCSVRNLQERRVVLCFECLKDRDKIIEAVHKKDRPYQQMMRKLIVNGLQSPTGEPSTRLEFFSYLAQLAEIDSDEAAEMYDSMKDAEVMREDG